jgi:hypothetical protein
VKWVLRLILDLRREHLVAIRFCNGYVPILRDRLPQLVDDVSSLG